MNLTMVQKTKDAVNKIVASVGGPKVFKIPRERYSKFRMRMRKVRRLDVPQETD